ncbi:protein roadkill-like [Episyrphus balteatus]|uniref:protein roadkill-like n=1 Tax=Episyrphus balteatus TaxID=286459 RepID=UPI0024868256|nr:protein roadkill-like [Episyrphus balteatus]
MANILVENWCHTKSNIIKFNFTWTIDNFDFLPNKTGESLRSSTFSAGSHHKSKWFLKIYPKGECEDSKDFISIYLHIEPFIKGEVLAKYNISILNSKGKSQKGGETSEIKYFMACQGWGYKKLVSRGYLLHKPNDVLPDNKLTVHCEVQVLSDRVNTMGQKNITKFTIPQCELANDLGVLWDTEDFSDVTLVIGDLEFPSHKNILSARSEVFYAMFEHDMEEQQSNRVVITDVDYEVMQELLHFIYTGRAPNAKKMADRLLIAADKYALYHLKVICEEAIFSGLSIETAATTLALADLHSAEQLKKNTIDFINNHAKEVAKTDEWISLVESQPSLVAETFQALFAQNSNYQLFECKKEKS